MEDSALCGGYTAHLFDSPERQTPFAQFLAQMDPNVPFAQFLAQMDPEMLGGVPVL